MLSCYDNAPLRQQEKITKQVGSSQIGDLKMERQQRMTKINKADTMAQNKMQQTSNEQ